MASIPLDAAPHQLVNIRLFLGLKIELRTLLPFRPGALRIAVLHNDRKARIRQLLGGLLCKCARPVNVCSMTHVWAQGRQGA